MYFLTFQVCENEESITITIHILKNQQIVHHIYTKDSSKLKIHKVFTVNPCVKLDL